MKILLVEDVKVAQIVTQTMLKTFSNDVDVADDGEQAIDILNKSKYDLVFMDLGLPGINGFEATRQIRMIENYQETPIVALTAHHEDVYRQGAMEAGMNDFIEKPLTFDKVDAVLKKFFSL